MLEVETREKENKGGRWINFLMALEEDLNGGGGGGGISISNTNGMRESYVLDAF